MTLLWNILAVAILSIIATEWVLWQLFRRRAEGLHLHLSSTTGRRVFTATRIRVCMMLHTIFLLSVALFSLLFLW